MANPNVSRPHIVAVPREGRNHAKVRLLDDAGSDPGRGALHLIEETGSHGEAVGQPQVDVRTETIAQIDSGILRV